MESSSDRYRRYRQKWPDRVKASQKAWRAKNPEKVRERNAFNNRKRDKSAHAESMREWRVKNPRAAKNADLKKSYGITIEQYEDMLIRQGGVCVICKHPPRRTRLAVDHDHTDGKVRELLCDICNRVLGLVGEDPMRFDAMAAYLRKWSSGEAQVLNKLRKLSNRGWATAAGITCGASSKAGL